MTPAVISSSRSLTAPGGDAAASAEIVAALAHAIGSLKDLASKCHDRGIDPMAMMSKMVFGDLGSGRDSRPASELPMPSDDELAKRSHNLVEAIDRADLTILARTLAPGFVRFHDGAVIHREALLATLMHRRSKAPYIGRRTWDHDRVVRTGDAVVFSGRAHEVQGGNDTHGGYTFDGWYLVQWVWAGGAWRAQLLTWQKETTDHDRWNEIFDKGRGFSHEPNRLLIETIAHEKPGAALDLATGQGRNALYLASLGWKVTGVDSAAGGLRNAREQALDRNLALETIIADIDEWAPGADRYDLVTMTYAGDHARWIDKIRASLREGGLFVVEGWAKESPDSPHGFSDGQLARLFDGYEILRDEIVDALPDWGRDRGKLVRFVARKR